MINENVLNTKEENVMNETPEELLRETINKIETILKDKYPDYLKFDEGSYTISYGSSQVMIVVRPYTKDETSVEFISQVVTGCNVSQELMAFLLRKNAELHYGGFGLLFDNTVTFNHSVTGSNLTKEAFVTNLNTVGVIADHYDDIIVEMAGGKRANDMVDLED